MRLVLNIQNDQEMRKYIRGIIREAPKIYNKSVVQLKKKNLNLELLRNQIQDWVIKFKERSLKQLLINCLVGSNHKLKHLKPK